MNTAVRSRRRRALSLAQWGVRLLAGALVAAAVLLMGLSQARPDLMDRLRIVGDSLLAPTLDLAARPIAWARETGENIASYFTVRRDNRALKAKLEDLVVLERTLERLAAENSRLRQQLAVTDWPAEVIATGRVIGAGGGPFMRSVLIDAGGRAGVRPRVAVVDKAGIVGRTVNVGPLVARVLLLTDLNSRIPVRIERTGATAILAGDNSEAPALQFLPLDADVAVGDRIVTSGHGGIFPPDLPVGLVARVTPEAVAVAPFADLGRLNFLTVVGLPPGLSEDGALLSEAGQGAPEAKITAAARLEER
ncbi:MAG: rod shape-determining protein MreC [Pseudomonadota bacterium]